EFSVRAARSPLLRSAVARALPVYQQAHRAERPAAVCRAAAAARVGVLRSRRAAEARPAAGSRTAAADSRPEAATPPADRASRSAAAERNGNSGHRHLATSRTAAAERRPEGAAARLRRYRRTARRPATPQARPWRRSQSAGICVGPSSRPAIRPKPYARPREWLVNTANTAAKGRNTPPYWLDPGTQAL